MTRVSSGPAYRIEIRCDVENGASRGIPKKLGFRLEGVLRQEAPFLRSRRDSEVWSLVGDEYAASPASRVRIKAFDAVGNALAV